MKHAIAFFNLEPWAEAHLSASEKLKAAGAEPAFVHDVLDKDHLPGDRNFEIAGVFVDSLVDAPLLAQLPDLRFVATLSTGFDHIDVAACGAKGIGVAYVPAYGENTVAEFTFGLILALSRKICDAHCRVKEERSFKLDGLRGFDLKGKTLGVVGTGRIGRHVIRIAKGFEMNVIAFDPKPDESFAREAGFSYKTFDAVLRESDIVSLHVPYMKETHHLINKSNIETMKQGAYLVNTSRGGIIETDALIGALRSGKLAGAALDVLEEENAIKDELDLLAIGHLEEHDMKTILENHVLISMPNVIITPHNAFNSREALERILDTTIDNIVGYINGAPENIVKGTS